MRRRRGLGDVGDVRGSGPISLAHAGVVGVRVARELAGADAGSDRKPDHLVFGAREQPLGGVVGGRGVARPQQRQRERGLAQAGAVGERLQTGEQAWRDGGVEVLPQDRRAHDQRELGGWLGDQREHLGLGPARGQSRERTYASQPIDVGDPLEPIDQAIAVFLVFAGATAEVLALGVVDHRRDLVVDRPVEQQVGQRELHRREHGRISVARVDRPLQASLGPRQLGGAEREQSSIGRGDLWPRDDTSLRRAWIRCVVTGEVEQLLADLRDPKHDPDRRRHADEGDEDRTDATAWRGRLEGIELVELVIVIVIVTVIIIQIGREAARDGDRGRSWLGRLARVDAGRRLVAGFPLGGGRRQHAVGLSRVVVIEEVEILDLLGQLPRHGRRTLRG
ncbi:hypothetical protein ENSA7_67500 [Enhygromyxa salina]|uniref:Uncharacterized protein n=1 Tax=Enhygromyxa salina TaxID=215803 RepID=A0A2S9XW96_9BACT|nr:hypothetical protein ENSA7_67500 [Enhygromyxa salina]